MSESSDDIDYRLAMKGCMLIIAGSVFGLALLALVGTGVFIACRWLIEVTA